MISNISTYGWADNNEVYLEMYLPNTIKAYGTWNPSNCYIYSTTYLMSEC